MSNYPHQQPYYPAPKKSHTVRNVILGVVIGLVLVIGGCMAVIGAGAKAASDSIEKASAPVTYRYHVEGTAKTATVTYMNQSGMSQAGDVKIPFDRDETFTGIVKLANLTATIGQRGGSVTCQVLDEAGKVLAENKASGPFASCSASPQPEPVK